MFKFAIIMRGIPGSGKSTTAHMFASREGGELFICDGVQYYVDLSEEENRFYPPDILLEKGLIKSAIHSTDQYFIVDGEYRFNPRDLGKFHNQNFYAFKKSIEDEIPLVICDNTNTTHWEMKKYFRTATRAGYITSVVTMPHPSIEVAAERNSHGVPEDAIRKMINRWEPWTGKK